MGSDEGEQATVGFNGNQPNGVRGVKKCIDEYAHEFREISPYGTKGKRIQSPLKRYHSELESK